MSVSSTYNDAYIQTENLVCPCSPFRPCLESGFFWSAVHAPVTGRAVIYSDSMDGKPVVQKGEHYDKSAMTAATHAGFPIGSMVKVTNLKNNKSVVVKVNDRMNPHSKSVIDLSMKAAEEIDMVNDGHVRVRVVAADK